MSFRNFQIGELEKQEIIRFDLLFRINAKGSLSVLLDREQEFLEQEMVYLLNEGLLQINDQDEYELSEKGKETLLNYGKMFQRFRDLSIFKCVYAHEAEPTEGEADRRFGSYEETACPPESEDYRLVIFENFCKRENRKCPLHLFVFFSLIENLKIEHEESDWIWKLANGEMFTLIEDIVNSQPTAEEICPEGLTPEELVDEIYLAGMKELKRCYLQDQKKYDFQVQHKDSEPFWVADPNEELAARANHYHYYEPYFEPQVDLGSALFVGAFAGLATCALLS